MPRVFAAVTCQGTSAYSKSRHLSERLSASILSSVGGKRLWRDRGLAEVCLDTWNKGPQAEGGRDTPSGVLSWAVGVPVASLVPATRLRQRREAGPSGTRFSSQKPAAGR